MSRKKMSFLKRKVIDFLVIEPKTYHPLRKVPTLKREISETAPGHHLSANSGEAGLGSTWEVSPEFESPWPGTGYEVRHRA